MTTTAPRTTRFEVIVSNVGVVCRTDHESEARASYVEQKGFSESVYGLAAGEDVTLMMDGQPFEEFIGMLTAERAANEQAPCGCPNCAGTRALHALVTGEEKNLPARDIATLCVAAMMAKLERIPNLTLNEGQGKALHMAIMKAIADHSDMT